MTRGRIYFLDGNGYRRSVELDVPENVDTDTLAALIAEIDPSAIVEYAVGA